MTDAAPLTLSVAAGFLFGIKHALDPDHLVAISTIVAEHKKLWRSSRAGIFWGIGHTITVAAVGLVVLGFKVTVSPTLAQSLELIVGLMLVVLGLAVAVSLVREKVHLHRHEHDGRCHTHLHAHKHRLDHAHAHPDDGVYRSLFVGMVHGLAGSAALTVLVLSAMPSVLHGLFYLILFGLGSIVGMMAMSTLIGSPFAYTARRFERANLVIRSLASGTSIGLGLIIISEMGSRLGLFP